MLRLALRLLVVSLVLMLIGWMSNAHPVCEVIRVASIVCLAAGFALLFVNYLRTPDPLCG